MIYNKYIEEDLRECLTLITSDWETQSNYLDRDTNFIYQAKSLDECLSMIKEKNANQQYALHRWYNYMTSIKCEYLFCEFGAIHEKDIYNHDTDIYIDNIPYDVKLTVYPKRLSYKPYDLTTRSGKNKMIQWYYTNQSQQGRKQLLNRLYVVCDGNTPQECLKMKCDFPLLRKRIGSFMHHYNGITPNSLMVIDNNREYLVYSDIIYISYD